MHACRQGNAFPSTGEGDVLVGLVAGLEIR
jgi:hypothetical protein